MGVTAEELLLRIQGDSSSGQQAVQVLADTISGALVKALTQVNQTSENTNKNTSELKKLLDELTPSTKNSAATFSDLKGTLTELWEDPIAGAGRFVKALAADLTPALGAVGIVAAVATAALTAEVVVLHELAEQSAAVGASIQDTTYKTGINVEAVSAWRGALQIAGSDLGQFGNAVFMMQRRMTEGGQQFQDGLDRIGLSMAQLQGLKPEQQFLKIAEGIRAIPDPAERAAAAMEVFGRPGRDLLPLIMKNLSGLVEESEKLGSVWSEQDAAAAEKLEMQSRALGLEWENLKTLIGREFIPLFTEALVFAKGSLGWILTTVEDNPAFKSLQFFNAYLKSKTAEPSEHGGPPPAALWTEAGDARATEAAVQAFIDKLSEAEKKGIAVAAQNERVREGLANLGIVFNDDADVVERMNKDWEESQRRAAEWKKVLDDVNSAGNTWQDTINGMDGGVVAWSLHLLDAKVPLAEIVKYYGLTEVEGKALEEQHKFLGAAVDATSKQFGAQTRILGPLNTHFSQWHELLTGVDDETGLLHADLLDINDTAILPFANITEDAAQKTDKLRAALRSLRDDMPAFRAAVLDALNDLPRILEQAFTGGGGVDGAIKALGARIGGNLGSEIAKNLKLGVSTFKDSEGNDVEKQSFMGSLGTSLLSGGIAGGISAGVGMLTNWLSNLGGPSKDELAARDSFKSIQQSGESLTDTITRLGAELVKAGKDGNEAQAMIRRALDATHISADAENAALKAINDTINESNQDQQDLNAAVQRYNFSISELGPTMRKQQLDAQAQQLLNDWRLLVGSGIELTTVNEHMAASVEDYLKTAKDTGTEVPAAMQPILQKMIDQGLLTDENGKKVTSLKDLGVTFSETMTQGFQKVVDKLQELIDKLNGAGDAIANIPRTIDVTTRYWTEQMGDVGNTGGPGSPDSSSGADNAYASRGGWVTSAGVQYLRDGTDQVRRLSAFAARGSDTVPAMLTPGEAVLTRSAAAAIGRSTIARWNQGQFSGADLAARFAGAGGVTFGDINVDASGSIFQDRAAMRKLARTIGDVLHDRVRAVTPIPLSQQA